MASKKQPKKIETIDDLSPDTRNANKGTLRGLAMLEDSLESYGAGRSILVDRGGNVIAGNKTLQAAADKGFDVEVVQTDGKKLIVVQRTDLDLNSQAGRELALADNRVSEIDLDFDTEVLKELQAEGVDTKRFWNDSELAILFGNFAGQGLDGDLDVNSQYKNMKDRVNTEKHVRFTFGEISTNFEKALFDRLNKKLLTYPNMRTGLLACFEAFLDE